MEKVNDLFLRATKEKFRFPYMGQISTEDLWDLSIENLDSIYGKLDEDLARLTTKTLIKDKKTNIEKELEDKIEIVKFIVEFKQAEIEAAKEKAMKSVKKQKILALIHEKENETLKEKSVDELKEMYDVNYYEVIPNKDFTNLSFTPKNDIEKIIRIIPIKENNKFKSNKLKLGIITINLSNIKGINEDLLYEKIIKKKRQILVTFYILLFIYSIKH